MKITAEHINRLIELESAVRYQDAPAGGERPFVVCDGIGKVMLSAPHGAKTFRNNGEQVWHEEDEYTAGMALLLQEVVNVPAIAMVSKSLHYDPNFTATCEYKDELRTVVTRKKIQYVIDLHGAALHSNKLDPEQTIDLGLRSKQESKYSLDVKHVRAFKGLLRVTDNSIDRDCFVVKENRLSAGNSDTVTKFVNDLKITDTENRVQALQIEMKPQVRVVRRMPTATLYQSCGTYTADPLCVMHMLQALADFIDYLNALE